MIDFESGKGVRTFGASPFLIVDPARKRVRLPVAGSSWVLRFRIDTTLNVTAEGCRLVAVSAASCNREEEPSSLMELPRFARRARSRSAMARPSTSAVVGLGNPMS